MPKLEISVKIPEGTEIVRLLRNDQGSWDCSAICYQQVDKWGVLIPSTVGYAFKRHKLETAIRLACEDAAAKMARLQSVRAAQRPKPKDELEELMSLL